MMCWLKKIFVKRNVFYLFSIVNKDNNIIKSVSFDNEKEMLNYIKGHIDCFLSKFANDQFWDIEDEELIYNYLENRDVFRAIRLFNCNIVNLKNKNILYRLEKIEH